MPIKIWILENDQDQERWLQSTLTGPAGVEVSSFSSPEAVLATSGAPDQFYVSDGPPATDQTFELIQALRERNPDLRAFLVQKLDRSHIPFLLAQGLKETAQDVARRGRAPIIFEIGRA